MHPSTVSLLKFFGYQHLPPAMQVHSKPFHDLAHSLAEKLEATLDGAELTAGLRKLLEAKDCVVRAAMTAPKVAFDPPEPIDTTNLCAVAAGVAPDRITILRYRATLTHTEAKNLAAYLVVLSDCGRDEFDRIRTAVEST